MMLRLQDEVSVCHNCARKYSEEESREPFLVNPEVEVGGVEEKDKREAPVEWTINDGLLSVVGPLVHDRTNKKDFDGNPNSYRRKVNDRAVPTF